MKKNIFTTTLFVFIILIAMSPRTLEKISIGDSLPHSKVKMKDISGNMYTLNDIERKNGLLVVFAANKCIAVEYWGDRLMDVAKYAEDNEIGVVWVNSNQTQRDDGESLGDMKKFAEKRGISFPYIVDEGFLLADKFGVEVTPTSYLFNSKSKLIYQGLVDGNMMEASSVKEKYLMDALTSLAKKEEVKINEKFGRGCRIPRN